MRSSSVYLSLTAVLAVTLVLLLARDAARRQKVELSLSSLREMARSLSLTDICLFTEARYTRNPALCDGHSPFQEHPSALEHFPSGSLTTPVTLRGRP